jgi:hypothetical protein
VAIRTYLTFKDDNTELLTTQIFGNDFWDTTFFNEVAKFVGKDCFPECEEVEVPFEEIFKLMEDVLVREIEQYPTKLVEKHDFDNYIFEHTYTNPLLDFTNIFISREDKTADEPNDTVNIDIKTTIASKVNLMCYFGKIFQTYNLVNKLEEWGLLQSKNPVRIYQRPVLKEGIKCFISQY